MLLLAGSGIAGLATVCLVVLVVIVGEFVALSGLDATSVLGTDTAASVVFSIFVVILEGLVEITVAGSGMVTGVTTTGVTVPGDLTFDAVNEGLGAKGTCCCVVALG